MGVDYKDFFHGKPLEMFEAVLSNPGAPLDRLMEISKVEAHDISDIFPILSEEDQKEFFKAWKEVIERRERASGRNFVLSPDSVTRVVEAVREARTQGSVEVSATDIAQNARVRNVLEVSQAFLLMHILVPSKVSSVDYLPVRELPDFKKIHDLFDVIKSQAFLVR